MDSSNSLGVELEYVRRGYIWPSQSYSTLSVGPLGMESQGVYRQKETYNMYTATANYIHKLDKDGSVLKLVTDYISKDLHGRNQYQIFQEIGTLNKDTAVSYTHLVNGFLQPATEKRKRVAGKFAFPQPAFTVFLPDISNICFYHIRIKQYLILIFKF